MKKFRKKRSIIWLTPLDVFIKIVNENDTLSDILRKLEISPKAGNYKTLKKRLKEENLDVSHLAIGKLDANKGRIRKLKKISLSEVLIENSSYSRSSLKKRLIKDEILKNICGVCCLEPIWCDKKLVLVLDHINGVNDDNRLENLRFLCPNCNSQTITFCGRHKPSPFKKIRKKCYNCNRELSKNTEGVSCNNCFRFTEKRVERPDMNFLIEELNISNFTQVSKKYGVSDNAIRAWLKAEGIDPKTIVTQCSRNNKSNISEL